MTPSTSAPIPFKLTAAATPIPYRPRFARDLGTLERLVVPRRGARTCAPPPRASSPRLAEAV